MNTTISISKTHKATGTGADVATVSLPDGTTIGHLTYVHRDGRDVVMSVLNRGLVTGYWDTLDEGASSLYAIHNIA